MRDRDLLGTEQRQVVETQGQARARGRELRRQVGSGCEDDAHDVVVGEPIAREELLDELG